jgi:hypothetical protein
MYTHTQTQTNKQTNKHTHTQASHADLHLGHARRGEEDPGDRRYVSCITIIDIIILTYYPNNAYLFDTHTSYADDGERWWSYIDHTSRWVLINIYKHT